MDPSSKVIQPANDWSRRLFWPAVTTFLVIRLWLSFTRYLNQDEFETLHQGWLIYSGAVQFRDFNSNHPPLSFSIVSLLNLFASDPNTLIRLGRLLTFASSIACLIFIHGISRSIYDSAAARWTVIAYAFNVTFWEWSTEIRSDFMMLPLWLSAVCLFVSQPTIPKYTRAIAIGLFMGLAFWANQKVIFHAVPLGLFMLLGGPSGTWKLRHTSVAVLGSLIPCAVYVGQAQWNGALPNMFQHNFQGAWKLVLSSDYVVWRYHTIRHALVCDTVFVLIGVIAGFWAIGKSQNRLSRFAGLSSIWMVMTLFLTPGPFQYYLTSVFPFFAISIGGWMRHVEMKTLCKANLSPVQIRQIVIVCLAIYLVFPLIRLAKFITPSIGYQAQVLRYVNRICDDKTKVFDGAGTCINQPDAYPFHWVLWKGELTRYTNNELPKIFPLLQENGCELVIDTYRVANLPAEDKRRIYTHFVRWWGPIRVPGYDSIDEIGTDLVHIELLHDGIYRTDQRNVLVDGEPMTNQRHLTAGKHTISLAGGLRDRVLLRRATKADDLRPADDAIDPSRFLGAFGYHF